MWQNVTLLGLTIELLEKDGFTLYLHHQVLPKDGDVALGQALVAARRLAEKS